MEECGDADSPLAQGAEKCQTFLVSRAKSGHLVLKRTYDTSLSPQPECKILEAARASWAESIPFDDAVNMDSGMGCCNPTALAIHEAHMIWPNRSIGCIVSIGTGAEGGEACWLPRFHPLQQSEGRARTWVVKMNKVSQWIDRVLRGSSSILRIEKKYFRFSVPEHVCDGGAGDDQDNKCDVDDLELERAVKLLVNA